MFPSLCVYSAEQCCRVLCRLSCLNRLHFDHIAHQRWNYLCSFVSCRYSAYTEGFRHRLTLSTMSAPSIECKRFLTKGLCVTCYGPTPTTVVGGEYRPVVLDTPSVKISRKHSIIITDLRSLLGHINWWWKVCSYFKAAPNPDWWLFLEQ